MALHLEGSRHLTSEQNALEEHLGQRQPQLRAQSATSGPSLHSNTDRGSKGSCLTSLGLTRLLRTTEGIRVAPPVRINETTGERTEQGLGTFQQDSYGWRKKQWLKAGAHG